MARGDDCHLRGLFPDLVYPTKKSTLIRSLYDQVELVQ